MEAFLVELMAGGEADVAIGTDEEHGLVIGRDVVDALDGLGGCWRVAVNVEDLWRVRRLASVRDRAACSACVIFEHDAGQVRSAEQLEQPRRWPAGALNWRIWSPIAGSDGAGYQPMIFGERRPAIVVAELEDVWGLAVFEYVRSRSAVRTSAMR